MLQPSVRKTIFALALGYALAIGWVVYADVVYHNRVTLNDVWVHVWYPVTLGGSALLAALLYDGNLQALGMQAIKVKYLLAALLPALMLTVLPALANIATGIYTIGPLSGIDTQLAMMLPLVFFPALCEEVMWRGLLYDTLAAKYSYIQVSLITGVLWAVWHYPIMIHTHFIYADRPRAFVLPMFTLLILTDSFIYSYIRKVSHSIWGCVVLHGLCNYISFVYISPTEMPLMVRSLYFKSDIGIPYLIVAVAMAIYFINKSNK